MDRGHRTIGSRSDERGIEVAATKDRRTQYAPPVDGGPWQAAIQRAIGAVAATAMVWWNVG